ncbi:MAG: UvrD-helicase domain-containing protein [Tenuifilaceae bacterium]
MSSLNVYKASAGSGKTFRLVAEYIKLVIINPDSYKRILAVTFTNKATAEMKGRILEELKNIADGQKTSMIEVITAETKINIDTIPARASKALSNILHDYSRFSVSTIDSFVQRIIQALLWEVGQQGGADIRLDFQPVLERAADIMLDESVDNPALFKWLQNMGESQLEEGKSWDIRSGLITLGKELFSESFRLMKHDEIMIFNDKEKINALKKELNLLIGSITNQVKENGKLALKIVSENGFNEKSFTQGSKGVYGFFQKCSNHQFGELLTEPNAYVLKAIASPNGEDWVKAEDKKNSSKFAQISGLISSQLHPSLLKINDFIEKNEPQYNSARLVLKNLDSLAILSDLWQTIRKLSTEEGFMLLADSGPLLREFVKETDAPFLYEKVGTRYDNFMIDEFQDTSVIQWQNFKPLIENSLAQGGFSMVVGDIKQAIYRWRNGDWRILSSGLEDDFKALGINYKPLDVNRRSLPSIIEFNNLFFTSASNVLGDITQNMIAETDLGQDFSRQFSLAYDNVIQKNSRKDGGEGYVEINFISEEEKTLDETLQDRLPLLISDIQKRGYKAGDIAILVRSNKDGHDLANMILSFKQTHPDVFGSFDVVSQEGLLLKSSPAIRLIIAAIRIIYQPNDSITRACLITELSNFKETESRNWHELFVSNSLDADIEWLNSFRTRPVQEVFEAIIERFGLLNSKKELAYISELHEQIVNQSRKGPNDIGRFLEWWEDDGARLSLTMPESENAITITTIHKSKGLQFPIVIIPHGNWPFKISNKQPLLWVSADQQPFESLPKYPIYSSNDTKKSYFSNSSVEEDLQVVVDNMNLLYVALTRAEDEFYVFLPEKEQKKETDIKNTSILIKSVLERIQPDKIKLVSEKLESGELLNRYYLGSKAESRNKKTKKDNKVWILEHYPAGETRASIKQRLESAEFFTDSETSHIASINYGKLMHNLFSRINYSADLDNALYTMQFEGLIDESQKTDLKIRFEALLKIQPYSDWFSIKWEVKNEASVITPEGSTYRPDRVMIKDKEVVVVDYKFGSENESYKYQIRKYSNLLQKMGYEKIDGYLWFVDSDILVKC